MEAPFKLGLKSIDIDLILCEAYKHVGMTYISVTGRVASQSFKVSNRVGVSTWIGATKQLV